MNGAGASDPLLSVRDLTVVTSGQEHGRLELLQRVSFDLRASELVGLVGESGAGKTLLAHAVLRLLQGATTIDGGEVVFDGQDLVRMSDSQLDDVRGRRIGLIPQDASLALNPVLRVEDQLTEVIRRHLDLRSSAVRQRAIDVLERVGLAAPERVMHSYPSELSGGMKQRVGIALALACDPVLLLADDPTSAVDVTIQAQILAELSELTRRTGVAILFITHDLRVISAVCSRVLVLYGGQLVEEGPVEGILARPRHPYTGALIACTPSVESRARPLPVVPGASPTDPGTLSGCRFHPRCTHALDGCSTERPMLLPVPGGRHLACWNPLDG